MLTDYHLHLRPDDLGTDAERYFTSANADRYRAVAEERGIGELGCCGAHLSLCAGARRLAAPAVARERR